MKPRPAVIPDPRAMGRLDADPSGAVFALAVLACARRDKARALRLHRQHGAARDLDDAAEAVEEAIRIQAERLGAPSPHEETR